MSNGLTKSAHAGLRPKAFGCPEYDKPPVVETALTIQFDELADFRAVHFGRFHEQIRDEFPSVDDQPPVNHVYEQFPLRDRKLGIEMSGLVLPRVWFMADGERRDLVQLQADRLSFNWRHVAGIEYPRFKNSLPKLLRYFGLLGRFCDAEGLSPIKPDLCEVVYVNHIRPIEGEQIGQLFDRALGLKRIGGDSLPVAEGMSLNRAFPIGERIGRLYAEASTARSSSEQIVVLKMTARVCCTPEIDAEFALQLGHDWVVNGFALVLDEEFQKARLGRKG